MLEIGKANQRKTSRSSVVNFIMYDSTLNFFNAGE